MQKRFIPGRKSNNVVKKEERVANEADMNRLLKLAILMLVLGIDPPMGAV